MNNRKHLLLALAMVAALTACGDDDDDDNVAANDPADQTDQTDPTGPAGPQIAELAAGSYLVAIEKTGAMPLIGRYLSGDDGRRMLAVFDSETTALTGAYRQTEGQGWQSTVALADVESLDFAYTEAVAAPAVVLADLAGPYAAVLADGSVTRFAIAADGTISAAAADGCALAGRVTASTLPGAVDLSITGSACPAQIPADASGIVIADGRDAPASLRLVMDRPAPALLYAFQE